MSKHHAANAGGSARFSMGHVLKLFVFYVVLAFCILAFTFFFVFTSVEYRLVIVLTLAFSIVATIVHVIAGRRSRVDTLIDKGPWLSALILLIVVILLLFGGGGGYYAYNNWGPQGGIGIGGIVLIVVVVLLLTGRGRSNL